MRTACISRIAAVEAVLRVEAMGGVWKITGMELVGQQQLEYGIISPHKGATDRMHHCCTSQLRHALTTGAVYPLT